MSKETEFINRVDFEKLRTAEGMQVVSAIVVDQLGRVMMNGFMNAAALEKTLDTGLVTFWSRTRSGLWTKGETSGNTMQTLDITLDCDEDSLLVRSEPSGPVCHRDTETCFDGTFSIELE